MIRYVELKNYKSLVHVHVDFMKTKTKPKNLILIYGENGVGKSNFATSFYTLSEIIRTMSSIEMWKKIMADTNNGMIRSFSNEKSQTIYEFVQTSLKKGFKDIEMIIKEYKTIHTKENMVLEYGFMYKGKSGVYHIEMNDNEIVSERLEYVFHKNQTYFFDIHTDSMKINPNLFEDKAYYNEFYSLLEKYWGKHSFLSILAYEIQDKKRGYVKKKISNSLYEVLTYLQTIGTRVKVRNDSEIGLMGIQHNIVTDLMMGGMPISEKKILNKTEYILNEIFTSLYSDIKKVYYKVEPKEEHIQYKLMVRKLMYGEMVDIDFELESTGTQNILDLIPYLIAACEGRTIVIDELDTGIHDLLVNNILENVTRYLKGQLIITTHNTMLIESSIPKENIYIFHVDRNAGKELIALTDFNGRIHKNINPRKKYLNGMYGGIPISSDIDFGELIDSLK